MANQEDAIVGTRGYRLRTEFFGFKEYHSSKAGRTLQQGREVIGLVWYLAVKNNHSSKAGRTLYQEREVTG